MMRLVEEEIKDRIEKYDFDKNTPISQASSQGALDGEEKWVNASAEFLEAGDKGVPDPVREEDKPFLMCIEDVFSIEGRGTVVTGRVERGTEPVPDDRYGVRRRKVLIDEPRVTRVHRILDDLLDRGQHIVYGVLVRAVGQLHPD